jgi:hypothetical protein
MKHSTKKINSEAPILRSPDGVEFRVTAGNKWKFNRAVQRDGTGRYSKLQKQIMTILIDSTNEGFGDDRSKWGHSYLGYESLAAECGCTVRAAIENIAKLEEKNVLTVKRSAGQRASGKKGHGGGGGRNKSNLYFLQGWNEFGRVENSEQETVHGDHRSGKTVNAKQQTVNAKRETVSGTHGNSERGSPDSSYSLSLPTQLINTPHLAPASGEREPARLDDPEEIGLPENHRSMSLLERFEFLRSAYESSEQSRHDDEEAAWANFREIERLNRASFGGLLMGIDEARQFERIDGKLKPFSDHLAGWLWDEDDSLLRGPENCRPWRCIVVGPADNQPWRSFVVDFSDDYGHRFEPCRADAPF